MLAPLDIAMSTPPWSRAGYLPAALDNVLPSDKIFYIHPIKLLVGQAWRAGKIPLWEPRLLAGYPIIGNAQRASSIRSRCPISCSPRRTHRTS